MSKFKIVTSLFSGLMGVTFATAAPPLRLPDPQQTPPAAAAPLENLGQRQQMLMQPPGVSQEEAELQEEPLPLGNAAQELSLDDLEQMALANNPAVAQAMAHVTALRGRWVQAGLPPNPTVGYAGTEIGNEGKAGQQGGFVGQEFVTGGKLRLNRAIVDREIAQAEQVAEALRFRVRTDVRRAYYATLVAQRRLDLAEELVRISQQAVGASQELLDAQEIPQAGLLQTQVEQQNAAILSQTAINEQTAAWRELSAVIGSELAVRRLKGDVSQLPTMLTWDTELTRLQTMSPEVAAAMANVGRAEANLQRQSVEPVPNLETQVSVQFDNATEDTITSVQLGLPLPIWNRNQGGIREAQAEVLEARRNVERVELDLQRRLSSAFQRYSTAHAQAELYSTQILPKARETFDLVQRGYRLGELGYLDFLTAQRTYSQTNLAYLDALSTLWATRTEIEGLLLSDSLGTAPH
jgi:cobalt-zinc-cadmium efflux system outer membrane protein